MIGAVGGLVFVLVNAGPLPGATLWRVLGVAAFVAALVLVARSRVVSPAPSPGALRVYGLSVTAMVLAIVAGANVLTRAVDWPELVLCWVVIVVGAHFVPFARAFSAPVFLMLGWALVVIGISGGAAVLAGLADAESWCGVTAGFVLLAAACWGAVRPAPVGVTS